MTKQQLASDRLENDLNTAIDVATARTIRAYNDKDTAYGYAKALQNVKNEVRTAVVEALRRNWRVSERARGERSVGDAR